MVLQNENPRLPENHIDYNFELSNNIFQVLA